MNTAITDSDSVALAHPVVSRERWLAERMHLLAREQELTRLRDQVARERRALPKLRLDKDYYRFDTIDRSQSRQSCYSRISRLVANMNSDDAPTVTVAPDVQRTDRSST